MKKSLSILLVFVLVFTCLAVAGAEKPKINFEDSSYTWDAVIEYDTGRNEYDLPVKIYADNTVGYGGFSEMAVYPTTYNINISNINGPPIRNQLEEGVCWSFAANSLVEQKLIRDKALPTNKYGNYNYSEAHMARSLSIVTSAGNTNLFGYNRAINSGGNIFDVLTYYGRGSGPVLESADTYTSPLVAKPLSANTQQNQKYVSDVHLLPYEPLGYNSSGNPITLTDAQIIAQSEAKHDKIKSYIVDYGGCYQAFYVGQVCKYDYPSYEGYHLDHARTGGCPYVTYNAPAYKYPGNSTPPATASYCPANLDIDPDHAVYLIGWDDNYPKENFATRWGYEPPKKGAFLFANSWGTGAGNSGYFWLSYYDKYLGVSGAGIANVKDQSAYDKIYQYDEFGVTGSIWYSSNYCTQTNIFKNTIAGEKLKAVSFYTDMQNVNFDIYFNNGGLEYNKTPILANKNVQEAGYHTIDVPEQLITGSNFTITIKFRLARQEPYVNPVTGRSNKTMQQISYLGESYLYPMSYSEYAEAILTENGISPTSTNLELYKHQIIEFYNSNADLFVKQADGHVNNCIKAHTDTSATSVHFRNAKDEAITAVESGNLSATVKLKSNTLANPYIAFSLTNGLQMKAVDFRTIAVGNTTIPLNFTVPAGSGYKINTMVIDYNTLKPLLPDKIVLQ